MVLCNIVMLAGSWFDQTAGGSPIQACRSNILLIQHAHTLMREGLLCAAAHKPCIASCNVLLSIKVFECLWCLNF